MMATNKWCAILLQLVVFIFNQSNGQSISTVPCKPVLKNYFDYLNASQYNTYRYLAFQATFILENRYVAYYTGSLFYVKSSDSLNGTVTVSFSDRTWTPSCGSFLCPQQNFNYKNCDKQTIVINRSGSIEYTLNSWGNAKFTDQLQCYGMNQPLYSAPTAQSPSMFVMTLQEQQNYIPT